MKVEKNKTVKIIGKLPDESEGIGVTMLSLRLAKIYKVDNSFIDGLGKFSRFKGN